MTSDFSDGFYGQSPRNIILDRLHRVLLPCAFFCFSPLSLAASLISKHDLGYVETEGRKQDPANRLGFVAKRQRPGCHRLYRTSHRSRILPHRHSSSLSKSGRNGTGNQRERREAQKPLGDDEMVAQRGQNQGIARRITQVSRHEIRRPLPDSLACFDFRPCRGAL